MNDVDTENVSGPAGTFRVAVYQSSNPGLKHPWVFSVLDPEDNNHQGFARSRRSAERKVRRWIAKQEAFILRRDQQKIRYREVSRVLEDSGVDTWRVSRMESLDNLRYRIVRPGEILCSYRIDNRWQAVLFLDGQEGASESARTRFWAERHALRELQKIYRHEALRALGTDHAPD